MAIVQTLPPPLLDVYGPQKVREMKDHDPDTLSVTWVEKGRK